MHVWHATMEKSGEEFETCAHYLYELDHVAHCE